MNKTTQDALLNSVSVPAHIIKKVEKVYKKIDADCEHLTNMLIEYRERQVILSKDQDKHQQEINTLKTVCIELCGKISGLESAKRTMESLLFRI